MAFQTGGILRINRKNQTRRGYCSEAKGTRKQRLWGIYSQVHTCGCMWRG